MVGVAGRSKACHTCLKRRIKCDESKPFCNRCIKSGYTCKGYDRKLDVRIYDIDKGKSEADPAAALSSHRKHDNSRNIPQELCLIAFKDDIHFSFLFTNFVWSQYGSPWLQEPALGKMGTLPLEACKAFSLGTFGKQHNLLDLEIDGAKHYDRALRSVSSLLSRAEDPGSEHLIVPIMIFLMQASLTTDSSTAIIHVQGLIKLLQVCGPKKFRTEALRPVFESCRATLITIGLIMKSRSFLETKAWQNEPWSDCPFNDKTAQNQLVDILAYIPGFLHDQSQLDLNYSLANQNDLVNRVSVQLEHLRGWRYQWQEQYPDTVCELEPRNVPSSHALSAHRPFRSILVYSNFTRATEIALYNAVLIILIGILWSLKPPSLHQSTSRRSILVMPDEVSSLRVPALEICRTFEFQLAMVKNQQESTLFWLLPLGVASKVLEDDDVIQKWIADMLDSSRVTRGYGTGANAYGFGNYQFPKI